MMLYIWCFFNHKGRKVVTKYTKLKSDTSILTAICKKIFTIFAFNGIRTNKNNLHLSCPHIEIF
jgi:hypothetical protein